MVLSDRVRFPVPLFDDKNIMEYLYQTKDTESHEDSDFCYGWGRNMTNCVNCGAPIETDKKVCPYCKTPYENAGNYSLGLIGSAVQKLSLDDYIRLSMPEPWTRHCEEPYFDEDGILHRIVPKNYFD